MVVCRDLGIYIRVKVKIIQIPGLRVGFWRSALPELGILGRGGRPGRPLGGNEKCLLPGEAGKLIF